MDGSSLSIDVSPLLYKAPSRAQRRAVLSQIPPDVRELAADLIRGSNETYNEFSDQERLIQFNNKKAQAKTRMGKIWYFAQTKILLIKRAISVAQNRIRQDHAHIRRLLEHPVILRFSQEPVIAWIGCSDSRIRAEKILQTPTGNAFIWRTIGGMLGRTDNPKALCDKAKDFIVFAKDVLHIPTIVVSTHGKCGCIANADIPKYSEQSNLSESTSVIYHLRDRMSHVVDEIGEKNSARNNIQKYLNMAGNPPLDNDEARLLALELAHCLQSYDLVQSYINLKLTNRGETPSMKVVAIHVDPRTYSTYIYNPETKKFISLTGVTSAQSSHKVLRAETCAHAYH